MELIRPKLKMHIRHELPGSESAAIADHAETQQARIRAYFKDYPGARLTPPEVQRAVGLFGVPLTSIRRALTELTKEGELEKHEDDQRPGLYGPRNCTWSLAEPPTAKQASLFDGQVRASR